MAKADVETSNGIIHIIDKVLMPPSLTTVTPPVGEICYDMDTHTMHKNIISVTSTTSARLCAKKMTKERVGRHNSSLKYF